MVFSSAVFLWLFFPAVFCLNLILPKRCSNLFLLAASLLFYAWGEPRYLILILVSILVNWVISRGLGKESNKRGICLLIGVLFNLSMIGYYKYFAFLADIAGRILHTPITVKQMPLPIGISFFTFQAISFLVDVYRGDVDERPGLTETALYISFFPQLIAGPIVKYRDISRQVKERAVTVDGVTEGFRRFLYGLGKKVLIANILGLCADTVYGMEPQTIGTVTAWVGTLAYTFQIYYDFSGYSDMAIGLGRMFGFTYKENFDHPYLSCSITEFWRRWHISLGSWFREYVYIPLGGNRKGKVRTYVNLSIVFFLTGFWHGAAYTFLFWGIWHGFFMVIERLGLNNVLERRKILGWIYSMIIVHVGWVFFRSTSFSQAFLFLRRMVSPSYRTLDGNIGTLVPHRTAFMFFCAVIGSGLLMRIVPERMRERWSGSTAEAVYLLIVALLCFASVASNSYNPFIYFNF